MKMFKGGLLMPKIIKDMHCFMAEAERFGFTTKKVRMKTYLDFLYCKARFRCTVEEYLLFGYNRYKNSYRKYFLTNYQRRHSLRYVNKVRLTMSKMFQYERLKDFYGREIFFLSEHDATEFTAFVKKHKKVFLKPDKASCGRGAEVFGFTDNETCQNKFEALSKKDMICEEFIFQCKEISDICPTSVNSCRILTLRDGQTVSVIAATFKTSKGSSFVDNMHADGIGAAVDVKTGVVITEGRDYANNTFIYHPMTGMVIPGIQLPFWSATLYLVKKAHLLMPESAVLGWDIAFTDNGPIIIEVNGAPGPNIHQFADKKPKGRPIMEFISNKKNRTYKLKDNIDPNA